MVFKGLEFWANKDIMHKAFRVYGHIKGTNGSKDGVVQPFTVVVPEDGTEGMEIPPMMELTYESATSLMNELWNSGVRPTDVGSPGELSATKSHLEDMRKIVFDLMELKK